MKDIKDFRIGNANYTIQNNKGSKLKLLLNYRRNSYLFKVIADLGDVEMLKKQAQIVAKSLLGKKAQRNLAYKLVKLKI